MKEEKYMSNIYYRVGLMNGESSSDSPTARNMLFSFRSEAFHAALAVY